MNNNKEQIKARVHEAWRHKKLQELRDLWESREFLPSLGYFFKNHKGQTKTWMQTALEDGMDAVLEKGMHQQDLQKNVDCWQWILSLDPEEAGFTKSLSQYEEHANQWDGYVVGWIKERNFKKNLALSDSFFILLNELEKKDEARWERFMNAISMESLVNGPWGWERWMDQNKKSNGWKRYWKSKWKHCLQKTLFVEGGLPKRDWVQWKGHPRGESMLTLGKEGFSVWNEYWKLQWKPVDEGKIKTQKGMLEEIGQWLMEGVQIVILEECIKAIEFKQKNPHTKTVDQGHWTRAPLQLMHVLEQDSWIRCSEYLSEMKINNDNKKWCSLGIWPQWFDACGHGVIKEPFENEEDESLRDSRWQKKKEQWQHALNEMECKEITVDLQAWSQLFQIQHQLKEFDVQAFLSPHYWKEKSGVWGWKLWYACESSDVWNFLKQEDCLPAWNMVRHTMIEDFEQLHGEFYKLKKQTQEDAKSYKKIRGIFHQRWMFNAKEWIKVLKCDDSQENQSPLKKVELFMLTHQNEACIWDVDEVLLKDWVDTFKQWKEGMKWTEGRKKECLIKETVDFGASVMHFGFNGFRWGMKGFKMNYSGVPESQEEAKKLWEALVVRWNWLSDQGADPWVFEDHLKQVFNQDRKYKNKESRGVMNNYMDHLRLKHFKGLSMWDVWGESYVTQRQAKELEKAMQEGGEKGVQCTEVKEVKALRL